MFLKISAFWASCFLNLSFFQKKPCICMYICVCVCVCVSGPGYLHSEDRVVWLWHPLVNLYIYVYIYDFSGVHSYFSLWCRQNVFIIVAYSASTSFPYFCLLRTTAMECRIFKEIFNLKSCVHLKRLIYTSLQKYSY